MGIKGLLPFLKDQQSITTIKTFKGCTVAVDTYCWLHRGVYGCVEQIAYGNDDGQYVTYCMKYVRLLISWGMKPILVFDGHNLPAKEHTEKQRRERRQGYRQKALAFLQEGKKAEARQCLERCIDITPAMAARVMEAARSEGVDCIVAPYEADAQLAYLNRIGIAQLIISEDSDLLLFGCERVFFKLDLNGNGILIESNSLAKVKAFKNHFTFEKFMAMCVLSGCDYLASLPGIGLAKACKFVSATRQGDISKTLKRLPTYLNMPNLEVTDEYVSDFDKACKTFRHQLVFDPLSRRLVPLNDYPPDVGSASLPYAGKYVPNDLALQMALGNVSCKDGKTRLANFDPASHSARKILPSPNAGHQLSIWDTRFRPGGALKVASKEGDAAAPSTKHLTAVVSTPAKFTRTHHGKTRAADVKNCTVLHCTDSTLASMYTPCHDPGADPDDDDEVPVGHSEILFTNDVTQTVFENFSNSSQDSTATCSPSILTVHPKTRSHPLSGLTSLEAVTPGKALAVSQLQRTNVFAMATTSSCARKERFNLNLTVAPQRREIANVASQQRMDHKVDSKATTSRYFTGSSTTASSHSSKNLHFLSAIEETDPRPYSADPSDTALAARAASVSKRCPLGELTSPPSVGPAYTVETLNVTPPSGSLSSPLASKYSAATAHSATPMPLPGMLLAPVTAATSKLQKFCWLPRGSSTTPAAATSHQHATLNLKANPQFKPLVPSIASSGSKSLSSSQTLLQFLHGSPPATPTFAADHRRRGSMEEECSKRPSPFRHGRSLDSTFISANVLSSDSEEGTDTDVCDKAASLAVAGLSKAKRLRTTSACSDENSPVSLPSEVAPLLSKFRYQPHSTTHRKNCLPQSLPGAHSPPSQHLSRRY